MLDIDRVREAVLGGGTLGESCQAEALAFDLATCAVFGPDGMERARCCVCDGVDAHSGACYDSPAIRRDVHARLCRIRDRVQAAILESPHA